MDLSRAAPGLPETPDLPAIERALVERWRSERGQRAAAGAPEWDCYSDPLPASELPGLHHAQALVVTDLLTRFRSMRGYAVSARTAWSCHGLPVEVAVEQQLGIASRADLDSYGAERFAERCREFAGRHVAGFSSFGERIGCGPWLRQVPETMDPAVIEAVWSSLKAAFDRGLLTRQTTIRPYCPRCESILSQAELTGPGVFREAENPVIIVRFPLTSPPPGASVAGSWLGLPGGDRPAIDLLVATAEPWTLPANGAVAVDPAASYAVARRSGFPDRVVVADGQFARVLGDGWYVTARISGAELVGATYQPPFQPGEAAGDRHVISGAFVSAAAGTGLMHLAPAFGEAGFAAAQALRLPIANPIQPDGRFGDQVPLVSGEFFKDAGPALISDLANRGLLFSASPRRRQSAHCTHCGSPLLRSARPAWILRAESGPDDQQAADGRQADWTVSRTRLWGTPLPVWECEQGHLTCAGSRAELSELAGADLSGLDPHRPWADAVVITCPRCGSRGNRVAEVVDARYDAAVAAVTAMASGRPSRAFGEDAAPGVLVTSAEDPGWPEALARAERARSGLAWMTPIEAGPVLDDQNRQMRSRAGNTIAAGPLIEQHGADAVRWHCLAASGAASGHRLAPDGPAEVAARVLLRYWHAAAYLTKCAGAAGVPPAELACGLPAPPPESRPTLDRWLLSELNTTTAEVTAALEAAAAAAAARQIERFVTGLSGWYLRRSRSRLGAASGSPQDPAALATLHAALETLTRLMAPFTPFVTSRVWRSIRPGGTPESVHLCPWPVPDHAGIDEVLASQMALTRRLARLGRQARASAGVGPRHALDHAWVSAEGFPSLPPELKAEIVGELNVAGLKAARLPRLAEEQPGLAIGRDGEAVWLDPGLTAAMRLADLAS